MKENHATSPTPLFVRLSVLVVLALISLIGLMPMLIGGFVQFLFKKEIHPALLGSVSLLVFGTCWYAWGWLPLVIKLGGQNSPWPWYLIAFNLILSALFVISGAALCHELRHRKKQEKDWPPA